MNIYKISRSGSSATWDEYISAVVCAVDEEQASIIQPSSEGEDEVIMEFYKGYGWVRGNSEVKVELLGKAEESFKEPCIIEASYLEG